MLGLRVVKGKVVGNTVLVEEALPEGAEVEVRVEESFVPDEETAKELAMALKEADAGDFVSEADFWKQMKARRQKWRFGYMGVEARDARTPGIRRVLLRTEHVLYYRVNAKAGFIEVLRAWHMSRGQTPKL